MLKQMKKHTDIMRAIKKNNPALFNQEGIDVIHEFLCREYYPKSMSCKLAIGDFLRNSELELLEEYSYDSAVEFRRKNQQQAAYNGWKNISYSDAEISEIHSNAASKYWASIDSKAEGYLRAIQKGKNVAADLDITASTDQEFLLLSGLRKRLNFEKLDDNAKYKSRISWKRSNLLNENVRNLLNSEYPAFTEIDIKSCQDDMVEQWYFRYNSIRSANTLISDDFRVGIVKAYSAVMNTIFTLRSELEKAALREFDKFAEYIEVEPYHIKYKRDGEVTSRRYCPDFIITFLGKKFLVEVKPSSLVEEFKMNKSRYIDENIIIITEKDLRNVCIKEYFTN